MKKEKTIQANYRLPESLLTDLKFVSDETQEPQSAIVRDAIRPKIEALKKKIARRKAERDQGVAA